MAPFTPVSDLHVGDTFRDNGVVRQVGGIDTSSLRTLITVPVTSTQLTYGPDDVVEVITRASDALDALREQLGLAAEAQPFDAGALHALRAELAAIARVRPASIDVSVGDQLFCVSATDVVRIVLAYRLLADHE